MSPSIHGILEIGSLFQEQGFSGIRKSKPAGHMRMMVSGDRGFRFRKCHGFPGLARMMTKDTLGHGRWMAPMGVGEDEEDADGVSDFFALLQQQKWHWHPPPLHICGSSCTLSSSSSILFKLIHFWIWPKFKILPFSSPIPPSAGDGCPLRTSGFLDFWPFKQPRPPEFRWFLWFRTHGV